ncbi:MAG TPA: DUF4350 domain-containing protein [Candidatus Krumholzibacteria bacterium]|nr:DUF4350 domain-containing protein [Candidatus Krumholzibacteria bacterium]
MTLLKKVIILTGFMLLVPVSLLLAYAYSHSQHEDRGWPIRISHVTYTHTHPRVVIDRGHHNAHTARGKYYPFATLLRMDGCKVKSGHRSFSAGSLKNTDVLVIVNASGGGHPTIVGINLPFGDDHRDRPAFSSKEIEAVRAWVEQGGSLLLIADHAPYGAASAPLAAAFGVHMHQGFTEIPNEKSDPMLFSRSNGRLPEDPITAGSDSTSRIERVFTFTGQSLDGPADATILLALPDSAVEYIPNHKHEGGNMQEEKAGNAQGLAFAYGKGRVVVLGEAAMLTAQVYKDDHFGMNTPGCDNQQFALNIVHWLTHTI